MQMRVWMPIKTRRWSGLGCVRMVFVGILVAGFSVSPALSREIDDWGVMLAVERELSHDASIPWERIDVAVDKGIVTLSGSVNHLLARERAARTAETVKGVRSVINRIEVAPPTRSDEDIRSNIAKNLQEDAATESVEVDVAVDRAVVTLTGTVDSRQERFLCAQVARAVQGVKGLQNHLEVDFKTERNDAEIQSEIERRLRWDVWVNDAPIEVTVNEGVVTLSGTVSSVAEKRRAHLDAWVAGVTGINDKNLVIDWRLHDEAERTSNRYTGPDREIEKAVKATLVHDPRVKLANVEVDVDEGVATLSGTVITLEAKMAAAEDVGNTVGVWRVKNHLKVRPVNRLTNWEILERLEEALLQNPAVHEKQIDIEVSEGIVHLYGNVDASHEKSLAEDIASRIRGVIHVENHLEVRPSRREKSDWEIRADIRDELWWSTLVDSDEVEVDVTDGVATLTGTVDTLLERRAATQNAYEGGAVRVRNYLTVAYGPETR